MNDKQCPKCGSNQPCIKICLNKQCGKEYMSLICIFCHKEAHFIARTKFPDIDLDIFIYDFMTQVNKIEEDEKNQYNLVLSIINQGFDKIKEILRIQDSNQIKLTDLKDELISPSQKAKYIVEQIQKDSNFQNVNDNLRSLFQLAQYNKRLISWENDTELNTITKQINMFNYKSDNILQIFQQDSEKLKQKQITEDLKLKQLQQNSYILENFNEREKIKQECVTKCNQYLQMYSISWRWSRYQDISINIKQYEDYKFECLKKIANNKSCGKFYFDLVDYLQCEFRFNQYNMDQYDCNCCGKWRNNCFCYEMHCCCQSCASLYNCIFEPIGQCCVKIFNFIFKNTLQEYEFGDGQWLGEGKGQELYDYFKQIKEILEE